MLGAGPLGLLAACGGGGDGGNSGDGGSATPRDGSPTGTGVSGLRFPGDNVNRRFRRVLPVESIPAPYPLTVVFQLFPEDKGVTYQTGFFHGIEGDYFANSDKFYGAGPYPLNFQSMRWEIAANASDFTGDVVQYNRWYQCAFIAFEDAAGKHHRFYYDLPDTSKLISVDLPASYFASLAATQSFTWGDAPWDHVTTGLTKEQFKGVMRRLKIFTAALPLVDATSEALADTVTSAAGAASLWYLNPSPTPNDIADKSGNGNDFRWFDPANRAGLWTAS